MNGIFSGIRQFYTEIIAPMKIEISKGKLVKKTSPLSRLDFNIGSVLALVFLIQKIACSILFFGKWMFTAFNDLRSKNLFLETGEEVLKYACAIPLGLSGFFFPHLINEWMMKEPTLNIMKEKS